MNRIVKTLTIGLTILLGFVFMATPVFAEFTDPFQDTCDSSSAANSSSVCQDKGRSITDSKQTSREFIAKVSNIIAAVGGIIAVVFVMINGLTILTSTGDSAKINKARDGLIYASVGIAVIVMARIIVALIMRFV